MKKVVIFGTRDLAELAHYYLTNDSPYDVAAFSLSQEYLNADEFKGLPVAAFETIEEKYPPDDFAFFAPMSPRKMSRLRADIYQQIKAKGYELISYVSSKATRFNNEIGENCFILADTKLEPFTNIGNNVVMWNGSHVAHHGIVKDHVFLAPEAVLSGHCTVEPYCFCGVNSTVRDGVRLAEGTLVGMSAGVTKDTEEWSVYIGNPAKKVENKLSFDSM